MKSLRSITLLFCTFAISVNAQNTNRMLNNGLAFLKTPYMANTLDVNDEEELVINCDEVDCTTFVEYVLAMALATDQGDEMLESEFADNVQKIRYRDGIVDGYPSRLHYTTDWINNNIRKGLIEDVTAARSKSMLTISVSYMSEHPQLYTHLKDSPENVAAIAEQEKNISGQRVQYLPKEMLPPEGLPWIQNGDIITFTTDKPGLDISHMGIAIYIKDQLHLLHASSKEKMVVVEEIPLSKQLDQTKNTTGIRVLRMKN